MPNHRTYISFDWALKKMLRHKANFGILEGFLTELLKQNISIQTVLESESNAEDASSKINRVDLLVKDGKGRLIIIELQYSHELDYFHRMLFSTSKTSTEYLNSGYDYSDIPKTFCINLLYFELGQGEDYVYHGTTSFRGIHRGDVLLLSQQQKERFLYDSVSEIFPEYYVLKINKFNDIARDTLDEWIYFLKNSEIPEKFKAKGLQEAREKMRYENLSKPEKKAYEKHQLNLISDRNVIETARIEGLAEGKAEGILEGILEGKLDVARQLKKAGHDYAFIAQVTCLSSEIIENLDADND